MYKFLAIVVLFVGCSERVDRDYKPLERDPSALQKIRERPYQSETVQKAHERIDREFAQQNREREEEVKRKLDEQQKQYERDMELIDQARRRIEAERVEAERNIEEGRVRLKKLASQVEVWRVEAEAAEAAEAAEECGYLEAINKGYRTRD